MRRRAHAHNPDPASCNPVPTSRPARPHAGTTTIAVLSSFIIITAGLIGLTRQVQQRDVVLNALATQALIQDYGADVQVGALQCRRYEKDLFLNLDDSRERAAYLEKWKQSWQTLSKDLDRLEAAWTQTDAHNDIDFRSWRQDAESYGRHFLDIAGRIERGEITSEARANRAIAPFKDFARRIIDDADEMKERAEELVGEHNALLASKLSQTMALTLFLMIAPSGLIVLGQVLFNRQMAGAQEQLRAQNRALAQQEAQTRKLATIAALSDNGVFICDAEHRIEWVNNSFTRMTGLTLEDVVGRTPESVLPNTEHEKAEAIRIRDALLEAKTVRTIVSGATPAGQAFWIDVEAHPVHDERGRVVNYVSIQRDITRHKLTEKVLRDAARTDQLTYLPNRLDIHERIGRALKRAAEEPGHGFAVLFLDFDRFKIINDSLGHDVGDMLLVEIAGRLRSYIRSAGRDGAWWAARLGGDEFVLLMEGVTSLDEARTRAEALLEFLSASYQLDGHEVRSTASIGIVLGDETYQRAEEVIRDADTAMYRAKAGGKARAVSFDRDMLNAVQARQRLETDLHHAVSRGEMTLEYQPIVSLDSGAVQGFETLVRWDHPKLGRIMPNEFIYIAEETGQILQIGNWVLRQACRQIAQWRGQYPDARWTMNINLSRSQLMSPGVVDDVRSAIEESGARPGWISLEITETSIMRDMETATTTLNELKTLGVSIVMDDFGKGQSSLHCLQRLPLDMLKIDKTFVSNLETNLVYPAIIQAIATLTHNMKIGLVAEGVETANQVAQLQALECGLAQGYLFARPMPPDRCMQHLFGSPDGALPWALRWSA